MKKLLFIFTFFISISFSFAQVNSIDVNILMQFVDILQRFIQGEQIQTVPPIEAPLHEIKDQEKEKKIEQAPGPTKKRIKIIQPPVINFPRGVKPALPEIKETKQITPEIIKSVLPDDDRNDDTIVQINNLRITRILLNPGIENVKASFFAVRDTGWKCMFFESEESPVSLPCALELRKPILQKELVIQIKDNTILLLRNRQKANLENFNIGDKINVYGFMDKDSHNIDALIVRKIVSVPKAIIEPTLRSPIQPKLLPVSTQTFCVQVITPAYNPQNPLECKEFPTPCDVPEGWIKTNKCLNNALDPDPAN